MNLTPFVKRLEDATKTGARLLHRSDSPELEALQLFCNSFPDMLSPEDPSEVDEEQKEQIIEVSTESLVPLAESLLDLIDNYERGMSCATHLREVTGSFDSLAIFSKYLKETDIATEIQQFVLYLTCEGPGLMLLKNEDDKVEQIASMRQQSASILAKCGSMFRKRRQVFHVEELKEKAAACPPSGSDKPLTALQIARDVEKKRLQRLKSLVDDIKDSTRNPADLPTLRLTRILELRQTMDSESSFEDEAELLEVSVSSLVPLAKRLIELVSDPEDENQEATPIGDLQGVIQGFGALRDLSEYLKEDETTAVLSEFTTYLSKEGSKSLNTSSAEGKNALRKNCANALAHCKVFQSRQNQRVAKLRRMTGRKQKKHIQNPGPLKKDDAQQQLIQDLKVNPLKQDFEQQKLVEEKKRQIEADKAPKSAVKIARQLAKAHAAKEARRKEEEEETWMDYQ